MSSCCDPVPGFDGANASLPNAYTNPNPIPGFNGGFLPQNRASARHDHRNHTLTLALTKLNFFSNPNPHFDLNPHLSRPLDLNLTLTACNYNHHLASATIVLVAAPQL